MSNWGELFTKLDSEETMRKAHGDIPAPIIRDVHKPPPVLVIEAKSFPDAAKIAFRTMTYWELVQIAHRLKSYEVEKPISMANALWRWANEDASGD